MTARKRPAKKPAKRETPYEALFLERASKVVYRVPPLAHEHLRPLPETVKEIRASLRVERKRR